MRAQAPFIAGLVLASTAVATHHAHSERALPGVQALTGVTSELGSVVGRAIKPLDLVDGVTSELGISPSSKRAPLVSTNNLPIVGGLISPSSKRAPLVGTNNLPVVGGLTSGTGINPGSIVDSGASSAVHNKKILPYSAASRAEQAAKREPLVLGLGSVTAGKKGGAGSAPAPGLLKKRVPLVGSGGSKPSLGGVTSGLGLNSKGNKDSLVPISLGGREETSEQ